MRRELHTLSSQIRNQGPPRGGASNLGGVRSKSPFTPDPEKIQAPADWIYCYNWFTWEEAYDIGVQGSGPGGPEHPEPEWEGQARRRP